MAQDSSNMADTGMMRVVAQETTERLAGRLAAWLAEQPEVAGVTDLGMGIFGLAVRGPSDEEIAVSLVVQPTQ